MEECSYKSFILPGMSHNELDARVESDPQVVVCWKWRGILTQWGGQISHPVCCQGVQLPWQRLTNKLTKWYMGDEVENDLQESQDLSKLSAIPGALPWQWGYSLPTNYRSDTTHRFSVTDFLTDRQRIWFPRTLSHSTILHSIINKSLKISHSVTRFLTGHTICAIRHSSVRSVSHTRRVNHIKISDTLCQLCILSPKPEHGWYWISMTFQWLTGYFRWQLWGLHPYSLFGWKILPQKSNFGKFLGMQPTLFGLNSGRNWITLSGFCLSMCLSDIYSHIV